MALKTRVKRLEGQMAGYLQPITIPAETRARLEAYMEKRLADPETRGATLAMLNEVRRRAPTKNSALREHGAHQA